MRRMAAWRIGSIYNEAELDKSEFNHLMIFQDPIGIGVADLSLKFGGSQILSQ